MKSKVLLVATAAIFIIFYISCKWFNSSPSNKIALTGKWQMLNLSDSSKDSSKHLIGLLLFANEVKDSIIVDFNADSTVIMKTAKSAIDSGHYTFNEKVLTVFGTKDTTLFNVDKFQNDSLLLSSSKDSLHYIFKKIK